MTSPDALVARLGEVVSLSRITVPVYDANGSFSESLSAKVVEDVRAIVSQPRERDLPPRMQGQESLRLTVASTVDIRGDRSGRPDRVTARGRVYDVIEVRDDRHPFMATRKRTVLLAQHTIPGGTP